MSSTSPSSAPSSNISTGDSPTVQVIEHGRDIHMYRITDVELDIFKSNYTSLSFGFWQLCLGIFIGFLVPLLTLQLSNKTCAIFTGIVIASGVLAVFFGINWGMGRTVAERRIKQVKERVPPI
jgi:hypothetical protein